MFPYKNTAVYICKGSPVGLWSLRMIIVPTDRKPKNSLGRKSLEIVYMKKIYITRFHVEALQNDLFWWHTFLSTQNFRIKSEISTFIFQ